MGERVHLQEKQICQLKKLTGNFNNCLPGKTEKILKSIYSHNYYINFIYNYNHHAKAEFCYTSWHYIILPYNIMQYIMDPKKAFIINGIFLIMHQT